ncbi:hypothetical protein Scep_028006 [Stephania cephalantha]|uniref:Uncharacterized protein n=1 Tax=Stephania cephalantha TaxID=152367 RepID=A0AAP0E934_9MAGN
MNTCVIRSKAVMWQYAHQKRVVRTTSSDGVAVCPPKESCLRHELQWCGYDPTKKKSDLHCEISNLQVVTIDDVSKTLTVGLVELDGGHNGHYDHQWFTSPRG